jgi:hypothetical protein
MGKREACMPAPSARSLIEAVVTLMRGHGGMSFPAYPASHPAPGATHASEDVVGFAADLDAALALRTLARRGPDEACLLPRRLTALDLDPDEIARLEPAMFRELHWRCTVCDSKGECAVDLAGDAPASPDRTDDWHAYCPNAATLRILGEIPWFDGSQR